MSLSGTQVKRFRYGRYIVKYIRLVVKITDMAVESFFFYIFYFGVNCNVTMTKIH